MDYVAERHPGRDPDGSPGDVRGHRELRAVPRVRPVELHHRHHAAPRRRCLRVGGLVELAGAGIREQPARLRLRARRMTLLARAQGLADVIEREAGPARSPTPRCRRSSSRRSTSPACSGSWCPRSSAGRRPTCRPCSRCTRRCAGPTGPTGWTLLANATTSAFAGAYTGPAAVAAMFGGERSRWRAGQFSPRGTAVRAGDARYAGQSGRYSFGSGSAHVAVDRRRRAGAARRRVRGRSRRGCRSSAPTSCRATGWSSSATGT